MVERVHETVNLPTSPHVKEKLTQNIVHEAQNVRLNYNPLYYAIKSIRIQIAYFFPSLSCRFCVHTDPYLKIMNAKTRFPIMFVCVSHDDQCWRTQNTDASKMLKWHFCVVVLFHPVILCFHQVSPTTIIPTMYDNFDKWT